ncbi:MAG: AMP-binding protein, partial [bacterium]|nr:AMP-binding protein [bacterium]
VPAKEKRQLLQEFNDTAGPYPADKTIHQLVEEQAARTPGKIALERINPQAEGDTLTGTLTYRQLNEKANRWASHLRKKGVKTTRIVAILTDHSLEMAAAILGVLKAGAAYLPISPDTPPNRIETLLQDSGTRHLLTTGDNLGITPGNTAQQKEQDDQPLKSIPLLGFENADIRPFVTTPRPQEEDLDRLQNPDRSLIDYEKYRPYIGQAMVKNSITIHMSRGCVYNCAYCFKIWPKKYILRSAENIFDEIKLFYQMGVRRFAFVDDLPNFNIEVSSKLFQMIIEKKMKIHLHFPNGIRGDILTKEYIDLMVAAGAITMDLALETTSHRLQKMVRKNLNLGRLAENVKYITERYPHVILETQILHGIPTETEEEARASLEYIKNTKWFHFPYIHILNIYPRSDMAEIAVQNGIPREAIQRSADLAYHELPETLPFTEAFTRQYQSEFLNEYFLSRERLLAVLPHQMKVLTEDELVQKYDSYLPMKVERFQTLLDHVGIRREELDAEFLPEDYGHVPGINQKLHDHFAPLKVSPAKDALKVLLLDLSQYFTHQSEMMYDVVEPPLGLMYLMTHLQRTFGAQIEGKIAKSRIDFDNYDRLKELIHQFKPDVIGIRTLNFYKDFFHKTVSLLKQWEIDVPIIAGGPYATSNYPTLLKDKNIDLAVVGEGEITLAELI